MLVLNVCTMMFFLCQESQYIVKVESPAAGGPTLHMGEEQDNSPSKLSKEELIQSMDRVDREIAKVEQQISKLKKKQVIAVSLYTFVKDFEPDFLDIIVFFKFIIAIMISVK